MMEAKEVAATRDTLGWLTEFTEGDEERRHLGFDAPQGHYVSCSTPLMSERVASERLAAAREFVKRHPALSLIDLAEFDAFVAMPEMIAKFDPA